MANKRQVDWLTLSGVAALLGVHPSTVRLWSDKGLIPTHRTSGGHRRYLYHEIDLWMGTSHDPAGLEPDHALQGVVGHIQTQISEGRLEAETWYQKLNAEAREAYRQSGVVFARSLLSYLVSGNKDDASDAFAVGYEHASRARRYGMNSVDAVRAFLFFRNNLLESLFNAYDAARVPPGPAWGQMLTRLHGFTDHVLITLLETCDTFENAHL